MLTGTHGCLCSCWSISGDVRRRRDSHWRYWWTAWSNTANDVRSWPWPIATSNDSGSHAQKWHHVTHRHQYDHFSYKLPLQPVTLRLVLGLRLGLKAEIFGLGVEALALALPHKTYHLYRVALLTSLNTASLLISAKIAQKFWGGHCLISPFITESIFSVLRNRKNTNFI